MRVVAWQGILTIDKKNLYKILGAASVVPSRGDRHRSCPSQDLQLDGGALDASDAQSHASVVDFVVAKILLEYTEEGLITDTGRTKQLNSSVTSMNPNTVRDLDSNIFKVVSVSLHTICQYFSNLVQLKFTITKYTTFPRASMLNKPKPMITWNYIKLPNVNKSISPCMATWEMSNN